MEFSRARDKVVVILGPTASGKSRLSIDIASIFPSEIINSDKIQVYKGLDITSNKISLEEQLGIPHHLLGNIDSSSSLDEISTSQYRSWASLLISEINNRGNIPIVVGGSNSFVYSLLAKQFNPNVDVFSKSSQGCFELKYDCCFLWVYVSPPILNKYIDKRVNDMLEKGMLNELAEFHRSERMGMHQPYKGLAKAIGVQEFEEYFKRYASEINVLEGDEVQRRMYEEAVKAIKENTCELARRQAEKINFLKTKGWNITILDGTYSLQALLDGSKSWFDTWETQVLKPSVEIVKSFLKA
ncbi:adenylate isopentenyltransferase 1, chloroplastic-like [Chenopodium quinoa]|uniref:adenylate isopentenyltransferase 1, chloroplastic-like n=1 Tax=Chenopodium quinoa TaxID=63459 RepID=UPI000B78852D|nr:adenylate isopentenyltransferase 1, chloroplastic-like [Chenopodium quinoa]